MVDIISKKSGPRREDVVAKRIINRNWSTISKLADQLSNGGYTRSRNATAKAKQKPETEVSNLHIVGGGASKSIEPDPFIRISLNNRVVIMDARSGKQLQFLGEFRFHGEQKYFILATKENGFFATVDEETEANLADLNGVIIESDAIQQAFIEAIKNRLELNT